MSDTGRWEDPAQTSLPCARSSTSVCTPTLWEYIRAEHSPTSKNCRRGSEKLERFVFVCLFFPWTVPRENAARASSARWFRPDGSRPWPIQRPSCSICPTIRVGGRSGRMRQKETDPRGLPAPGGCQRIFRIPIPGITQQVSYCVLCSTRITKKKKERTSLHVACERCGAFVLKVVPQNASNYTGKRGGPFLVIYSNLNSQ